MRESDDHRQVTIHVLVVREERMFVPIEQNVDVLEGVNRTVVFFDEAIRFGDDVVAVAPDDLHKGDLRAAEDAAVLVALVQVCCSHVDVLVRLTESTVLGLAQRLRLRCCARKVQVELRHLVIYRYTINAHFKI